jgi:hypothetical protein
MSITVPAYDACPEATAPPIPSSHLSIARIHCFVPCIGQYLALAGHVEERMLVGDDVALLLLQVV